MYVHIYACKTDILKVRFLTHSQASTNTRTQYIQYKLKNANQNTITQFSKLSSQDSYEIPEPRLPGPKYQKPGHPRKNPGESWIN